MRPRAVEFVARRLPLILLPPSEGKASGGSGPPWAPGCMALDLDGVPSVRSPFRFSDAALKLDRPSPALGADTEAVLGPLRAKAR